MYKLLLGEDHLIAGQVRMIFCNAGTSEVEGANKYKFGGSMFTDANIPEKLTQNWVMMPGTVIFIPQSFHTGFNLDKGRIDQILVSGFANEQNWKKHHKITDFMK